jgi:hypothetical protein
MADDPQFHDWRPTTEQELLLKAALLRGPDAAAALRAWKGAVRTGNLDGGSRRLLPLLYRNIRDLQVPFEAADQLKRAYFETWANNQVLLAKLPALLKSFEAAGIRTLVLKGASLITRFYGDRGLRPMKDIDVLVPTNRGTDAVAVLAGTGWGAERKPDATFSRFVSVNHGVRLWNAAGLELDLHWHVLNECLGETADAEFWAAAVPMQINGAQTLALCPTDELFHTCVHGVRWNPIAPVRWVADAHAILRSGATIDWQRVVSQAGQRRLILTVRAALAYLQETFHADVPSAVMDNLNGLTVSREEAREWRSRTNRPGWTLSTPPFLWAHYPRVARDTGRSATLFGFLVYLQAVWDVDHLWQVPLFAISRSLQRLFRRTSPS